MRSSTRRGNAGAVADGSAAGFENARHRNVRGSTPIAPPIRKANRSGIGIAWKANGTPRRMGIVRSAFRHLGNVTGQESDARSKRDGWPSHWGSGPHVSAKSRKPGEAQVRMGLVPYPRCKRGRFGARGSLHPVPASSNNRGCSLTVEQVSATHQVRFQLPAPAPNAPGKLIW